MKRHAMVVLLVCIIIFFYFIRRNYFKEDFLTYGGATTVTGSQVTNVGTEASNICYNKVDGNFYVAVTQPGKIIRMTPSGAITDLVTTSTVITGTTNKLASGDPSGPWGICADNDGNVYFSNQQKSEIYKIPSGSTTPQKFASAPSGSTRPMGMCCGTNNVIWVVYANGTSRVVGYNTDGTVNTTYDAGSQSMSVGVDSSNNVYWAYASASPGQVIQNGNQIKASVPQYILGMIFDSAGNMYFVGSRNGGQVMYSANGTTTSSIYYNFGSGGNGQGICWGPNNEIYASFNNGTVIKVISSCKPGTSYSANGTPPCTPCPTTNLASCPVSGNPTCNTGYAVNTDTGTTCDPIPCATGTFSDSGSGTCTPCPANATCTNLTTAGIVCNQNFSKAGTGASTNCQPTPCVSGTNYSATGKMPCDPCPANFATCPLTGPPTCTANFNYNTTTKLCDPKPCTVGTNYSSSGNMPCQTCPANSQCTGTGFTCSSGFELNTTTNTCLTAGVQCPIGSYSATGASPAGTTDCPTKCPTGFTTGTVGSKLLTDCKRSITPQDLLTWLNTNNYNIVSPMTTLPANAKYYGLTIADFIIVPGASVPMLASGATYSGTIAEIETFLKPSIVAAATLNYANKALTNSRNQYFLTTSQGGAVNKSGIGLNFPIKSIPYTKGTDANKMNNIVDCTSSTDPTSCTYKWAGVNGPSTANPCPLLNAWFDFDQSSCIDGLGKPTTTTVQCSDSSVFNLQVNGCVPVRKPVKAQPPNTTGTLGNGDYKNCKTIDQGDCTVQYTLGTSITSTNPCSGSTPTYDFSSHSCKGSGCCSMTPDQAAGDAKCAKYVKTTNSVIASKCTGPKPNVCCDPKNASKPQCASFYTQTKGFNDKYTEDCPATASGFQDYKQQFNLTMPPRIKLF